jgi:hypothetical protein
LTAAGANFNKNDLITILSDQVNLTVGTTPIASYQRVALLNQVTDRSSLTKRAKGLPIS